MTDVDIIVETYEADLAPVFVCIKDVQQVLRAVTVDGRRSVQADDTVTIKRVQEAVAKTLCHWLYVPESASFEVEVRTRQFQGRRHLVVSCSSDSNVLDAQLFAIGMLSGQDYPVQVGLS